MTENTLNNEVKEKVLIQKSKWEAKRAMGERIGEGTTFGEEVNFGGSNASASTSRGSLSETEEVRQWHGEWKPQSDKKAIGARAVGANDPASVVIE